MIPPRSVRELKTQKPTAKRARPQLPCIFEKAAGCLLSDLARKTSVMLQTEFPTYTVTGSLDV